MMRRDIFIGIFLVTIICYTCREYYKEGQTYFLREYFPDMIPVTFIENPPQKRTNCLQLCQDITYFDSFDEYASEYRKHMNYKD